MTLFSKACVLYLLIAAGYASSRWLAVKRESIVLLLIYVLTPVVYLEGAIKAELGRAFLLIPLYFYLACCFSTFVAYQIVRAWKGRPLCNLLGYAGSLCNNGFLGIPLGLALLGEDALPQIIMCGFGITIFESTIGLYVLARGRYSIKESIARLVRLPVCYALLAGLVMNYMGIGLGESLGDLALKLRGTYSVLGMMVIGMALAELRGDGFDWFINGFLSVWRFVFWPAMSFALLVCDRYCFGLFEPEVREVIFFISTLPLSVSTVMFASLFDVQPQKVAMAVLSTTMLAIVLVPLLNALARGVL